MEMELKNCTKEPKIAQSRLPKVDNIMCLLSVYQPDMEKLLVSIPVMVKHSLAFLCLEPEGEGGSRYN